MSEHRESLVTYLKKHNINVTKADDYATTMEWLRLCWTYKGSFAKYCKGRDKATISEDGFLNDVNTERHYRELPSEIKYEWKELAIFDDETAPRLVTPWSDPKQYEMAMDLVFDTVQEAIEAKAEWGAEAENWFLCKVTTEPVAFHKGQQTDEE